MKDDNANVHEKFFEERGYEISSPGPGVATWTKRSQSSERVVCVSAPQGENEPSGRTYLPTTAFDIGIYERDTEDATERETFRGSIDDLSVVLAWYESQL